MILKDNVRSLYMYHIETIVNVFLSAAGLEFPSGKGTRQVLGWDMQAKQRRRGVRPRHCSDLLSPWAKQHWLRVYAGVSALMGG